MSDFDLEADGNSLGLFIDDNELFDFNAASEEVETYQYRDISVAAEEEYFDDLSDDDDGLLGKAKIKHSTSDHRLKAKSFIAKTESPGFDRPQALEMLHRLYIIDYRSRRGGSKAANAVDEYYPLFFLDYINVVGRPLRPLTRTNDRFFDNVTVTFQGWQMPYTGKHQYKLLFDLQNRTFRLASAATRETYERLQSLEKETRLRPDDNVDGNSEDNSNSESDTDKSEEEYAYEDNWPLDLDPSPNGPDSLYSKGLRQLLTELDQKYNLDNISSISYALAVDLHCLDVSSLDLDEKRPLYMLADRNLVRREYRSASGASGLTFYPMAFHPAYRNFTSASPLAFLKDHVLAVIRDNISFQNDGADVLSCEYFQAYTNIKRSIRYNPKDLLVTQGIATIALTLPLTDAYSLGRIKAKQ
ncbi:hypothetical protein B0J14DRAFT_662058 [Halenospora varia]|nr:hypothetical protein B0J14DRAFT_662058 [Halenospora varia]